MKYKRFLIAVPFLAAALVVSSAVWVAAGTTGVISGVVRSAEDGSPLSGANVIVEGTRLTTVTGADGYYVITNVPPGDYEVTAQMVGFGDEIVGGVQVAMDVTTALDFDMAEEAIVEEAVVVTRPAKMIDPDVPTTLITVTGQQEELTKADPTSVRTVPGVLSSLPGVVMDPDGMGGIHLRGGKMTYVGYYIEGIPITEPSMGFFGTNLFTTGVGKFQTYPGGFGAQFGNAISGVLNEVKKTGAQAPGVSLDAQTGNLNFSSGLFEFGGESESGFSYYGAASAQRNDITGNSYIKEQEYSDNCLKLVWPWENDSLTLLALQGSLAGYLEAYHTEGNHSVPTPYERDFMRQRYGIVAATWSHNFSPSSFVSVRPYYLHSTTVQNMMGGYAIFLDAWSAQTGLQVQYTNQLNDRHLIKAGGSLINSDNNYYSYDDGSWYGGAYHYAADVDTHQQSLFLEDNIKLSEDFNAQAGVRYEKMKYKLLTDADRNESRVTPRLGVSYAQDDRTVWKASWGQYTKFVPSSEVEKIYQAFPFDEYGASEPQKSTVFDVSYERQLSDSMALRVTPFWVRYKNLGDVAFVGGIYEYANLGKGKSDGVEVFLRKKMSDKWQGWLSYTYAKTEANRADLGIFDQMYSTAWDQRHTAALVAQYRNGQWAHRIRLDYGSGRTDLSWYDPTLPGRAAPYALLSYGISYDVPAGTGPVDTVYLDVANVFNNRQTLQFDWDWMGTRTRYSSAPDRFVSIGATKTF